MKKMIKLLTNSLSKECCDSDFYDRLTTLYLFNFTESTKINELYEFLLKKLQMDYAIDDYISDRFSFNISEKDVYANIDFCLKDFLTNYDIINNDTKLVIPPAKARLHILFLSV